MKTNLNDIFTMTAARTRAARNAYPWYKRGGDYRGVFATDIHSAYGKPSYAKVAAFEYCRNLCASLDGWGLKILAHGCQTFSVGFEFCDPETGVVRFAYITRDYNSTCEA